MNERARPGDLCMADAMPFQQHHEYRTHLDIEAVLADPAFFLNVRDRLRPGDAVTICRYEDRSFRRVVAVADARVTAVSGTAVELHRRGGADEIPAGRGGWKARWVNQNFLWGVYDGGGRRVVKGLDKETAQAVARGDLPVPGAGDG